MKFARSFLLMGCLLAACSKPPVVKPVSRATNAPKDPHPETSNIQAASLMGYDGKALKGSVDRVIDANKAHNQQIQDAVNGQ